MANNDFIIDDYTKEKLSFNPVREQLFGFFILFMAGLIFGVPFFIKWAASFYGFFDNAEPRFIIRFVVINGILGIVIFIIGIIIHELLHGVFYAMFVKDGLKSIKFGIVLKEGYVYCESKEVMRSNQFIIGLMMPMIILGIIPAIISIFNGSMSLLLFGIVFTMAGAGDTLILTRIIKDRNKTWFENLPSIGEWNVYKPKK
ncbi:MAG: DUF3267 domain-containing protein [Defluviitaleaceae bacterium]|nr:DUF3267 domain-containing protein [Defluviitaleaceae bacterium]